MTMAESVKFLGSSKYIRYGHILQFDSYTSIHPVALTMTHICSDLLTVVVGYGMAINIVEVTWKSKLKAAFPDPNSYSSFMGNFSTATGIVTLLMMLMGKILLSS